ncbi:transposable element Tcb1 transposase [Trichonephila clavipes]|nr:transposable element Tcb1 transposase [Trichonephila clavipes]
MFLAGHPSQGCFGLQSHCTPCYFFNQASFYPSDFSFKTVSSDDEGDLEPLRKRTVRGRLLEIGLRGCKVRPKLLPTEFQRKRRLTWAREHSLWTIKYWEKVIFSDESQFCISGNQSSAYVRRRTHEEFSPQCPKPTVNYPTKVMVWGCMSSHGVGRLHIVSGTVKAMDYIEILQNKLLPTARDLLGNQSWIFQDDNVPCHCPEMIGRPYCE